MRARKVDSNHKETWLPVPGWRELYEVSDLGRVRSTPRMSSNGRREYGGNILTPTIVRGYQTITLCDKMHLKKTHTITVHRLVMLAFVGQRPDMMQTRHLDGNRQNNALSNLQFGTAVENCADTSRHGRQVRGSKHPLAKLTVKDVTHMRVLSLLGHSYAEIGELFKVSATHAARVVKREVWRHV
jgi:hypothetical protein